MASFEPRGKATRAVVSLGTGRRLQRTFDTKREAKQWAKNIEDKKALGKITAASSLLVEDVFIAFELGLPRYSGQIRWHDHAWRAKRWHETEDISRTSSSARR